LNEVDEVAAGVFKQDGDDRAHARWFTAKADTELLETAVLGGDVARQEGGSGNAGSEQAF